MSGPKTSVLIPIEGQARELDAKLLLACVAAERGYSAIIGSRNPIHRDITRFPRGVYMAKSMRQSKNRMFGILRGLGHEIVGWDEEAVVRFPRDDFYRRRLSPRSLLNVSHLFAWGEDDAQVLREYPELPDTPIHVTGNPRVDLLRPELRGYYDSEANEIRREYGDFLLINSNFGYVNAFVKDMNLLQSSPGGELVLGPNTKGMEPEFARGLALHKQALFERFLELLPALAKEFPEHRIVLRPHPSEDHEPWKQAARGFENVSVVHERSVIPWLVAAKAVIHNGCTTAVESALLGMTAIAYCPVRREGIDFELPNSLSHRAETLPQLLATVRAVASGRPDTGDDALRRALLERHIAALEGPLAADRMIDVLDAAGYARGLPRPGVIPYLKARRAAAARSRQDELRTRSSGAGQAYVDHRFPGTSVADLRERIGRFSERLGRFRASEIHELGPTTFRVEAGNAP